MSEQDLKTFTSDTLPEVTNKDIKRLKSIKDKDIDFSDIPELDETFWKNAELKTPENKTKITIRVDNEVLSWFKKKVGRGYQTRINAVLKTYVEAHKP